MSLLKACIFDLDGVIVDTVDAHFFAWKNMADELSIPFTEVENEQLKGVSRMESMQKILALGDIKKTDAEVIEYTTKKNDIYVEIISKMTPDDILPGVLDFIQLLRDNGIRLAIGSSSKNTPTILKAVGLDKAFEVIIDGNQIVNSKPHPEVFLKGAEAMGLQPTECVVLEDAVSGVEAAKRGGMKCIGVGEEEVLGKADMVVSDLTQLSMEKLNSLY